MNKLFKQSTTSVAVLVAVTLTGCARFEQRMQANGDFDYQNIKPLATYQKGGFSSDEARQEFTLPTLTQEQIDTGFSAQQVDIRPPEQLMPIIDGVSLVADDKLTKLRFSSTVDGENIQLQVWQLVKSYLAFNNVELVQDDQSNLTIETASFSQLHNFSGLFNDNEQLRESSFNLSLAPQVSANDQILNVDLLSFSETNDGHPLKFAMTAQRKKNVELRFVNDLLEFAYHKQQREEMRNNDSRPLTIKLGFDDNHQNIWIVENSFTETITKLPDLLTLLHFKIIESDRNLGYILASYSTPNDDYWVENGLNPFELKSGEYFIQLGELDDNITSISWLDKNKKLIEEQKITDMYLSISDKVRSVVLKGNKQTKPL